MDKNTILIVEDDMLILEMVSMKLSENGYLPQVTISGADVMSAVLEHSPRLIILDLMLPDKSGEEILKELKSQSVFKDIPVIIFTNKSSEENKEKLLAMGAQDYLVKASTDLNTLISTIDNTLAAK